jgi:hypothetical protein
MGWPRCRRDISYLYVGDVFPIVTKNVFSSVPHSLLSEMWLVKEINSIAKAKLCFCKFYQKLAKIGKKKIELQKLN